MGKPETIVEPYMEEDIFVMEWQLIWKPKARVLRKWLQSSVDDTVGLSIRQHCFRKEHFDRRHEEGSGGLRSCLTEKSLLAAERNAFNSARFKFKC